MLGFHLIFVLIFLVLLNVAFTLQALLFSFIPDPLEDMFNSSFYQHYGVYLDQTGALTIWSISSVLQKAGDLIGLLYLLRLVDTKGRKFVAIWLRFFMMMACGALFLLSYFLPSFEAFMLTGMLNGAGSNLKWAAVTMFLTEITPDQYRGSAIIFLAFGEPIGQILATVLCRPSVFGNPYNWYIIPLLSLIFLIISIFYLGWVPESPRFLAEQKKYLKAEQAIRFYHGKSILPGKMLYQVNKEILEEGQNQEISLWEMWNDEALRKVAILLFCIYNFADISCLAVEMLFYTKIHNLLGLPAEIVMSIGTISRVATIPLYFFSFVAIEKLGRRKMIMGSLCASYFKAIVVMIGLLFSFYLGPSIITQIIAIFADIISTFAGVFAHGQVFSLLCCELTPAHARVRIIQVISVISMGMGLAFTSLIPYAFNYFPPLPYIFLLFYQPILIIYVFRNLPETKGRAVYRIVEDFQEAASTRRTTIVKDELTPLLQ